MVTCLSTSSPFVSESCSCAIKEHALSAHQENSPALHGNRSPGRRAARSAVGNDGVQPRPLTGRPTIGEEPGWDDETVLRTPEVVFRTPPHVKGRAGEVNPPVTERANAARTEPGPHRLIDIGRTAHRVFVIRCGCGMSPGRRR